jgi:phosphate-selective porin
MKFIWSYLLVLAVMGMVVSVHAQEPKESEDLRSFIKAQQAKMEELSKVLEEQKLIIQAQSKLLEEQSATGKQLDSKPQDKSGVIDILLKQEGEKQEELIASPPSKSKNVKVEWGKDGRLNFKNEDGSLSSHFGIMMQYDSAFYNASDSTQDLLFSNNDLNQGSAFRRARIRSDGTAYEIMEWVFEMDFSRAADLRKNTINPGNTLPGLQEPLSNIMFNNMWVGFKNIPLLGTFRAGHIKEDLSYYSAGSGRTIPFMERPLVWDALEDPYLFSNGITLSRNYMDDMLYSWVGFFQTNTRTGAFNVSNTATLAFDARLCVMPIYDEDNNHWLNLGAAGSIRANPNEVGTTLPAVQTNVQPGVRAGSSFQVPNIIRTPTFYTQEGTQLFVLCGNYANGPFSFGAQYDAQIFNNSYVGGDITKPVNHLPGGAKPVGSLYFDGFSVEALCFLTRGDHRGTNKNNPMYVQVIPQNPLSYGHGALTGTGAWELGVRFDFVNTMIDVPDQPKPQGGYLSSTTLGLNWFLNANTTFMANYVYSSGYFGTDTERGAPGDGAFHAFGTRVMFIF